MYDKWGHDDMARVQDDLRDENNILQTDNRKLSEMAGVLKKQFNAATIKTKELQADLDQANALNQKLLKRVEALKQALGRALDTLEEYVPEGDTVAARVVIDGYAVWCGSEPNGERHQKD